MQRISLVRSLAVIAVLAASAACSPTEPAPAPAPASPQAAPPAPAAASPSGGAGDAATRTACTAIAKDLKENASKVAKAEKIGPPAGHIAVSAQWTAGSTAVIAHSIEAGETVRAAADEVQAEMQALSDAYNESPKAKPSKKKLEAAVAKLTAACSAG